MFRARFLPTVDPMQIAARARHGRVGAMTIRSHGPLKGRSRRAARRPGTPILGLIVAVGLVASACAAGSRPSATGGATAGATPAASGQMTVYVPGGTYTSVGPARLAEMLAAKDFVLVNVHVPYEGEIEGTDAFIPYDQVATRLPELPAAKDARIVVYCRSGRMSTEAARTLVGLGYMSVWELDGGMIAWKQAGYQLVQKPGS